MAENQKNKEELTEQDKMRLFWKETQKKYSNVKKKKNPKYNYISNFKNSRNFYRLRMIPTGIWSLDKTTGGIPGGKVVHFWGNPSNFKSTSCAYIMGQAQRTCRYCHNRINSEDNCKCGKSERMRVLYVDSEDKFDADWFERAGVDVEAEDSGILGTSEGSEETFNILMEILETGQFDLVIIDTWSHLTPSKEMEGDFSDWNIGLAARLGNKFMRTWTTGCQKAKVQHGIYPTLIIVNQKRMSPGVFASDTTTGGLGPKFASYLTLKYGGRKISKDNGEVKTVKYTIYISKSKIGRSENRQASFDMYKKPKDIYEYGDIDNADNLFDDAIANELIIKSDDEYTFNKDLLSSEAIKNSKKILSPYIEKKYKKTELRKLLKEDSDLTFTLKYELLKNISI